MATMEGTWRGRAIVAALMLTVACAATGCDSSTTDADTPAPGEVHTRDLATTFAPRILVDRDEPYRPMGVQWFLDRSALAFAEDQGCADRKIAVGRRLGAQQNEIIDWLFVSGLGQRDENSYMRIPYDADCELDVGGDIAAKELTRPYQLAGRPRSLRLGEGYFLDLMDWARPGPPPDALPVTPAYFDARRERVDGQPGLRIAYWLLFGMSEPRDADGQALASRSHEGDWERVDVLLRGRSGAYEPRSLEVPATDGRRRVELRWPDLRRVRGASGVASHPVLRAERGGHTLVAISCRACRPWDTWNRLRDASPHYWYGFGGAWGEVGVSNGTTGPLGPNNGVWPVNGAERNDAIAGLEAVVAARPSAAFAPLIRTMRTSARPRLARYVGRRRLEIDNWPAVRFAYRLPVRARGLAGSGGQSVRQGNRSAHVEVLALRGRRAHQWMPVSARLGDGKVVFWTRLERVALNAASPTSVTRSMTHPVVLP
jgi:hypothetical protein